MPQRNFGYRNRVTPPYGCLPVMSPYAWVIGDRFVGRHDHMPPHGKRIGFDKRSVGAGVLDGPPFTGNAIVRRTGRRGRRPLQRSIETIAFMRATARVAPTTNQRCCIALSQGGQGRPPLQPTNDTPAQGTHRPPIPRRIIGWRDTWVPPYEAFDDGRRNLYAFTPPKRLSLC